MNYLFDKRMKHLARKEKDVVPVQVSSHIDMILEGLPEKSSSKSYRKYQKLAVIKKATLAVAATFAILVNISPEISHAMEKIPVLGTVVKVITIKNYFYEEGNVNLDANIPQVKVDKNPVVEKDINNQIETWTNQIMEQFYDDVDYYGNDAHMKTDINYDVVTDTKDWFTLRINVTEIEASSHTYYRYYHIDKQTGELMQLSDLFKENSPYKERITQDIIKQMKNQAKQSDKVYFWLDEETDDITRSIEDNTNFYFTVDNQLVIAFNQYDVAPGYMGCPEFIIERAVYENYLLDK